MRLDGRDQDLPLRRPGPIINPVTLRDVYQHRGDYNAKLLIDACESPNIDNVRVEIWNSDGKTMEYKARRWGTKININFKIDERTPDGVVIVDVYLDRKSDVLKERFDFWVIKD